MAEHEVVGVITKRVIEVFGLKLIPGTEILCGESNIAHMKEEHPEDFAKYGDKIADIISKPTYICKHPKKDSIEYVKVFINENKEHVLVAIRASGSGTIYARTLFVMAKEKLINIMKKMLSYRINLNSLCCFLLFIGYNIVK
ncbi:MAG: PBECR2 nuclease fold domain-containing protein [Bacillota bacterium]